MKASIIIDGREVLVETDRDLLTTCLEQGAEVPHFCWHGALGSVGACRLCAVKVFDGPDDHQGRLEMACMTPVKDGQRVVVHDPEAERFRARVIEWLMVNHPHDCAVCEEGGACHLQDMTIATGHHARRHRFEKRTHRNQDLGPLLTHEMNRCIGCYRCTRFYRHYAGGRDLDVFGAHDRVYFGRAEDGVLESPFAGNLAEVCPTGVFNDKGWSQVYARKWDMRATPSVCAHCAVGCNTFLSERGGRLRRVQNRYHGELNGYFLCDRGRFGPLFVEGSERLKTPLIDGARADEGDALAAAREAVAKGAIGVGSPRASLEANFALRKLVGAENFYQGVSDAEARAMARMAAILRGGPARIATVKDVETADAALVLGEDLTGAAPRLALALRQTAKGASDALAAEKGVPAWLANAAQVAGEGRRSPIALVTPTPDPLDDVATWALRRAPDAVAPFGFAVAAALAGGDVEAEPDAAAVAAALKAAKAPLVLAGLGLGHGDALEAAAAIVQALGEGARLALAPPEANSLGLALLGGAGLESAAAALGGSAAAAIVLENGLAERASPETAAAVSAARVVALDHLATATAAGAAVALPVASFAEAAGTWINFEGRAQRAFAAIPEGPPAAWRVLAALAPEPFGWETLDDVLAALSAEFPALAGARDAAPSGDFRTVEGPVARGPRRLSGRTADDRAGRVEEGVPPTDPDSALGWTMEGAHGLDTPPALRTGYDGAGLHSASAAHRFMATVGGPLKGGDPGLRLLAPDAAPVEPAAPQPAEGEGLLLAPLHDPFAATEPDRASPLLAARAPAPRLRLNPKDAAALGLAEGAAALVDGAPHPAPVALDPTMPKGVAGLAAGFRGRGRRVRVEAAR